MVRLRARARVRLTCPSMSKQLVSSGPESAGRHGGRTVRFTSPFVSSPSNLVEVKKKRSVGRVWVRVGVGVAGFGAGLRSGLGFGLESGLGSRLLEPGM